MEHPVQAGVDIGGTFTDLILVNEDTGEVTIGKRLTTPGDPSQAVQEGLALALERARTPAALVGRVIHGTTLVTNAIIERKGDPTALVATRGFRDVLEIAREHRYDMYDLFLDLPQPLVPRHLRLEVDERTCADGAVATPLDRAQVERLAAELQRKGIKAVAVALLHSYRNPAHERAVGEILARIAPDVQVALSSEVVPEIKEYERTSTTVANAYVMRLVGRYLSEMERKLAGLGIPGALYVMLSSGGAATVETGRRFPVRLLESGPAAGALGAAHVGGAAGYRDLLSFDMGGTTAKLCIIEDGRPLRASEFEVDRVYRFKKGSGLPIRSPVIEMIEIGAGGGSIARVDALGLLKVGPDSSGADPGPACYAHGGREPTVTDADLVLGYLDPRFFLGGEMALDVGRARAAIEERVADRLGLDVVQAAWGVHRIVNENMANAARIHAIERGKDVRQFPLFAFGGAGPVHAFGVGTLVGSSTLIIPRGAGVGSAIGLLAAPPAFDFVYSSIEALRGLDWPGVNRRLKELGEEGRALLGRAGLPAEQITVARSADMRYAGQGHEVNVRLPDADLSPDDLPAIIAAFERVYRELYGRVAPGVELEAVNWRVVVSGPPPQLLGSGLKPSVSSRLAPEDGTVAAGKRARAALKGERAAYWPDVADYRPTPVYDRDGLKCGARLEGPAIVEERESTAIIGPGALAEVDEGLNLVVHCPVVPG